MPATRRRRRLHALALTFSALLVVSFGAAGQSAADPSDGSAVDVVDLHDAADVATWTTVNDPVMGGKSTSTVTFDGHGLVFSGDISLENNGGFASARSPQDPEIGRKATGATSFRVRAVGDGKTYLVKVGVAGQPWSYIQRFPTEAAVQRTYDLPVAGFEPVGMRLDPDPDAPRNLDPSTVDQVSLYILDGQRGPFALAVDGIDATG
ncbi:CIA30 family protein [Mycolicibacterium sp. P1-18]|uniref:CIA30 family protein n=1 Tax=Mycolicibacterium sp. P1-18 TaxID=2024615 RepID=UPI0011F19F5D|nr:CIA30 family protein [Mycolicibacterium sp. P1-18]KAA0100062.1 CIA30 family protein [Mycolicibacterium sp. P1-18]